MQMEQYLSAAEVAKCVGVHYRTIENWATQGHLSREGGKYGLISAFKYRLQQNQEELNELKSNPNTELKQQKQAADVDTQKAIARIKNLEADERAGVLVNSEQALEAFQNLIANAKAKLINIPSKIALELLSMTTPEMIQGRLMEVILEALEELSQ
jgi:phage terminase Nu1 subunit (DNA packaging protein)